MAKVIVRDLTDIYFATIKAILDEVAEDCPLLVVSSEASSSTEYILTLTIDTDLVASITLPTVNAYFGQWTVTFNGNSLVSSGSGSSASGGKFIIAYTDTFFFVWLKYPGTMTNTILLALYEKVEGEKLAYGYLGSSLPDMNTLYDMNKVTVIRRKFNGSDYASPQGYVDYMDKTPLYKNTGNVRVGFDDNFLYVLSNTPLAYNTVTINNKDYYAIVNQYLIPIDSE